jgi:uncharacterized membrane protein YeaQ/YmgE (transglycosylase-associated protein family)
MNLIIWLVVGGIIGWLASLVMRTDAQQGMILNVVVGIVGAAQAGCCHHCWRRNVNRATSAWDLLVSFGGAVILLFVVNLFRRGAVR